MPTFTLEQAEQLLPKVAACTAAAFRQVEALETQAEAIKDVTAREALQKQVLGVVQSWAQAVQDLGADVKGLWLVDFDSGDGYFCWKYPEPTLDFFHGYDEGFSGRKPLQPSTLH